MREQQPQQDLRRRRRRKSPAEADPGHGPRTNDSGRAVTKDEARRQSGGGDGHRPPSAAAAETAVPSFRRDQYAVAKWAILRLLGLVYFFAFLGAHYQNDGLMGRHGLEPASLQGAGSAFGGTPIQGFLRHPTLFWWVSPTDENLARLYRAGIVLSLAAVAGINSWLLQLGLWLLYFSIVTVAQLSNTFYSYGWESQLLETGFLAIFLCRLPSMSGSGGILDLALCEGRRPAPPSPVVRWLFCWLMFRISLGAGLIKVRGSSCWRDKTCLHYHFETQPIPSPLSFAFHFLPPWVRSRMVDVDLWVQLHTSGLVLVPVELVPPSSSAAAAATATTPRRRLGLDRRDAARWLLRAGGFLQVGFMVGILLSGNFAFLNHLTVIPGLACLDDGCFPDWLVARLVGRDRGLPQPSRTEDAPRLPPSPAASLLPRRGLRPSRTWLDAALLAWILFLSWPVIANLLQIGGTRQLMNASYDPFRIVNTYGAFGSVGEARYEAVVQVYDGDNGNNRINGTGGDGDGGWIELELPCKPGNVRRRPCFCAPYHYRLDWNIWFLGFKPHHGMLRRRESWMFSLVLKLLQGGPGPRPWLDLLDSESSNFLRRRFYDRELAPSMVRVDMYRYEMNKPLWGLLADRWNGLELVWWKRAFEENLIPPAMLDGSGTRLQRAPAG